MASLESLRWKSLSWACASPDKCVIDGKISHWSYPILSLAKRHFQRWERLLETFYDGLSQPKIVTFFLLGDHVPSPAPLAMREESEDTDRKEITPLIHTRQNALRGRQKSSDLEENCEA